MRTSISGLSVDACSYEEVLSLHRRWLFKGTRQVSFALHIGGLNLSGDRRFSKAFNSCDFAYADGVSVVLLAKLGGAGAIERSATTDLAHDLLSSAGEVSDRALRVALIGGDSSLLTASTLRFEQNYNLVVCYTHDGFTDVAAQDFLELENSRPDLLLVGMGMPNEAFFVAENLSSLPQCLIMTCGGWFGFVAGREARAPLWLQDIGAEWMYRLMQQPRRLFWRYAFGSARFLQRAVVIILFRAKRYAKRRDL